MTRDARHRPTVIGSFWRQLAEQHGDTFTYPAAGPRPTRQGTSKTTSTRTEHEPEQLALALTDPS